MATADAEQDVFIGAIERVGTGSTLVKGRMALMFDGASFAVTDDPTAIVTGARGEKITGVTRVTSTGVATLPGAAQPWLWPPADTTTADDSTETLFTIPIPAATTVRFQLRVNANLGAGPNANGWLGITEMIVTAARQGTGAPSVELVDHSSHIDAPFREPATSAGTGRVNVTVSGNDVLVQVTGLDVKEAWTSGHAYLAGNGATTAGDLVTSAGNVWLCTTPGTATGSAPTGTGVAQGTGAKFDCVGVGIAYVPMTWTALIWGFTQG